MTATPAPSPATIHDVPGWFFWADQCLFDLLLAEQSASPLGAVVELGSYLGKTAVLLGGHLRPGERLVACDLFGLEAQDALNARENLRSYPTLSRQAFEQNYLAFHAVLPDIVQAPSSTVVEHVPAGSARFVHVDASHLYEHVAVDLASARTMLRADGVVVFDDYRALHTVGVSAAVWEAADLRPFAHTPHKLYATFGDPEPHRQTVLRGVAGRPDLATHSQLVRGRPLLRVWHDKPAAKPAAKPATRPLLRRLRRLR